MTTNLIASILVVLVTNTVDHWPQKWMGNQSDDHHFYLNSSPILITNTAYWIRGIMCNDTNADSMTVETTVTRQRLLSVPFEGRTFTETITNESHLHYSVEMQRVRTNVWFIAGWSNQIYKVAPGIEAFKNDENNTLWAQISTNYFVPVKTNLPFSWVEWINSPTGAFQSKITCTTNDLEYVLKYGTETDKIKAIESATPWKFDPMEGKFK